MSGLIKKITVLLLIILLPLIFIGWGGTGHKLINKKTTDGFPSSMSYFKGWSSFLSSHASDADYRKSSDPDESPRHYIDIDGYPEFISTGQINQNMDSMVALHGYATVIDYGILPWAILKTTDSLTGLFRNRDWTRAQITAADLGHYVGDGHMPLHITENYNGQLSGQTGIHSRYESTMIDAYQAQLVYTVQSAVYVANRSQFVFEFIYENNKYVDSVLNADLAAKTAAGGSTSSSVYKQELWAKTKGFTIKLFEKSSSRLASLIYSAWRDAGSPDSTTFIEVLKDINSVHDFALTTYPNPFNAQVTVYFSAPENLAGESKAEFHIYSITGKDLLSKEYTLRRNEKYSETLNLNNWPSGIYYVVMRSGAIMQVKKIVLLK